MPAGGKLAFARYLISIVNQAVDAGNLSHAENLLELAAAQVDKSDQTAIADELRLTVLLENGTVAQHRGKLDDAERLAEEAVAFASEKFSFGIQHGRARLRLHYVWEVQRRYRDAQEANFALAEELADHPETAPIRLSCLTRALACAVKNADRVAQARAADEGSRLTLLLDERDAREILCWFFFWCALAQVRQNDREGARVMLLLADETGFPIGFPTWRWQMARQLAAGNLLLITPGREEEGASLLEDSRNEAQSRGFYGMVESIDAVFKPPGNDADNH